MKIIFSFVFIIACFSAGDVNARSSRRGCFENSNNRMYYVRGANVVVNGQTYVGYEPTPYYDLYPGSCPGFTIDNTVNPNTICYVGRNRGAVRDFEVEECDLDASSWLLAIPAALVGFAFSRKKSSKI